MNRNDFAKPITGEDILRRLQSVANQNSRAVENVKEGLNKTNQSMENYVAAISSSLTDIQDQVDGNITTWFYSGIPTLENVPASDWTTENDKIKHIGDLYYNQDTGYAYRFNHNNSTKEFYWKKITDNDVTEALAVANSAKDTADSKRQVFVVQPTTPYEVGDLWVKEDKELYRCRAKRIEGNFNNVDWIKATDYSNDDYAKGVEAKLNEFKTSVEENYVTNVIFETTKDTIESSVETITTKTISIDDTLNQMKSDINNNSTNINNTKQEMNDKFNDYATIESITEVTNKVENLTTSTSKNTEIITKIQTDGVTKLDTKTGFTMDKEGLHINKTGAPTSSTLDEAGVEIEDKTGNNNGTQFYSGYVTEELASNKEELKKYVGQTVTFSKNIEYEQYLSSKNWRIEDIEDEEHGSGLGFFYIGG